MTTTRDELMARLWPASRRYLASYVLFNQAVADHLGMHPTDVQCLNLLTLEDGPVTTGRIAELTGLTSGSATRLVDRLARAGLVARQRDEADRRRVLVVVLPEALDRFGEVWRELSTDWVAAFAEDSEDELAFLLRHMNRTVELGHRQVARLAAMDSGLSSDAAEPGGAGESSDAAGPGAAGESSEAGEAGNCSTDG